MASEEPQKNDMCEGMYQFLITAKVRPQYAKDLFDKFMAIADELRISGLTALLAAPHNLLAFVCVSERSDLEAYLDKLKQLGAASDSKVDEISVTVVQRSVQNGWPRLTA